MNQRKKLFGYLFVALSAVIYGTMPLFANLIYEEGVDSLSLVFLRSCCSFPVLALLAKRQSGTLRIPKKAIPHVALLALCGSFMTPFLLFLSYRYIPSGTATVFHFVYPAIVLLLGALFWREKVKKVDLLAVVICIAGVCLFYDPSAPLNLLGAAFSLLSGFAWAMYILLLSHFPFRDFRGFLFNFALSCFSILINLSLCLFSGSMTFPKSLKGWLLCLLFSLTINILATILFQKGTFAVGGATAAVLSTLEPITGIVLGYFFLEEVVGGRTVTGSVLVLGASLLIAAKEFLFKKKEEKSKNEDALQEN